MGTKSDCYLFEFKLTNKKTKQNFQCRGWKKVLALAGLSNNTSMASIKRSKKWDVEIINGPEIWDETAYRSSLYIKNKDKYINYELKKKLRDPLFERRKKLRLKKWRNVDGSNFLAEQHDLMLQQYCEVCGNNQKLCVDHDHETNIVRGVLCVGCNLALGMLKDSPHLIQSLLKYLENHHEKLNAQNKSK